MSCCHETLMCELKVIEVDCFVIYMLVLCAGLLLVIENTCTLRVSLGIAFY